MNVKTRLLRRPVTTGLWLLLFAAAAMLCVLGATVYYAGARLPAVLDETHTTIAVQAYQEPKDGPAEDNVATALFDRELAAIQALPMVKSVDLRTLTGAYIPELTGRIGLKPWGKICANNVDYIRGWHANDAYERVMLTGTVERAWTGSGDPHRKIDLSALGGPKEAASRMDYALLRVEEVVSAQPELYFFPTEDYTDYNGKVVVCFETLQSPDEPFFREGERYILQGYMNPACTFKGWYGNQAPAWLMDELCPFLESSVLTGALPVLAEGDTLAAYPDAVLSADPAGTAFPAENGGSAAVIDKVESLGKPLPLARRLTGTAGELFAADPAWAAQREAVESRLHCFPVLGTGCLESVYQFVTGDAVMEEGRFFTPEEYTSGAKVCVLSRTLAQSGDIHVGDVISLSQFLLPEGRYNHMNWATDPLENPKSNNPAVGWEPYGADSPHQAESFTVVGLYRQENEWEDGAFSFTPNTVFIPQKSQLSGGYGGLSQYREEEVFLLPPSEGGQLIGEDGQPIPEAGVKTIRVPEARGAQGVYFSILLENGRMEAFQEAVTALAERVPGLQFHRFLTFDQGYEAARGGIDAIGGAGLRLLVVIAGGSLLLELGYLLLCQERQRRDLGIMRSLGAKRRELRRYLVSGGWIPPALGILLGTGLALLPGVGLREKLLSLAVDQAARGEALALSREAYLEMLGKTSLPAAGYGLTAGLLLLSVTLLLLVHAAGLSAKSPRKLLNP